MNKFDEKLGRVYTGKFKDVKSNFPQNWENKTIILTMSMKKKFIYVIRIR